MSDTEAKRYVLLAMLTVGLVTVGRSLATEGELPSVQVPIAIFIVGLFLALAAEIAPPVAGGLAVLIVLSTLLSAGAVWDAVTRFLNPS